MKKFFATVAVGALIASSGAVLAGVGNGNGTDKGEKNGWGEVTSTDGVTQSVPKGLIVSGDNGRTDNGGGNGGENLDGETPNKNGEDAAGDNDDDPPNND